MNQRAWLALGLAVRLALVLFGAWQDASDLPVKYTDVDYRVFTDGAAHLAAGRSPFARATYRYSPLLAALMLPNVWLFDACGKLLLAAVDAGVFVLTARVARLRGEPPQRATRLALLWWLNPVAVNLSTRGSADGLTALLVLGMLAAALQRRWGRAGVWLGLAAHLRLYPVVHGPALLLAAAGARARLRLFAAAAGTFLAVTGACVWWQGAAYVDEGLLHHVTRADTRHNFSPLFYSLYLGLGGGLLRFAAFAPQAAAVLAAAAGFGRRDPVAAVFLQTLAFVALNKVVTAQYFAWWMALLPAVLPALRWRWRPALALAGGWLAAEVHWLLWAARLELAGSQVFLPLWVASLLLLAAHASLARAVVRSWDGESMAVWLYSGTAGVESESGGEGESGEEEQPEEGSGESEEEEEQPEEEEEQPKLRRRSRRRRRE